jgi:predicted dehydrogenase
MKIGMIGLDTSHCTAFARLLNDPDDEHHIPGGRVVAAYPGGSPAFSLSRNRVGGYTRQLADDFGLRIADDIPALVAGVDAILLESVDGRQHLEQFVDAAVGKPVFIDKPLATSVEQAVKIARIASETGTPLMSCSSLRYAAGIADLVDPGEDVESCEAFGPAALLDDYPGLFWYGVHSAEVLFSLMGRGCTHVQCMRHPSSDLVVGRWQDGRVGIMRGTRLQRADFGCVVHSASGTKVGIAKSEPPYYQLMLRQVIEFFETGVSPIDMRETLEITAFLEAAERSCELGGLEVATGL